MSFTGVDFSMYYSHEHWQLCEVDDIPEILANRNLGADFPEARRQFTVPRTAFTSSSSFNSLTPPSGTAKGNFQEDPECLIQRQVAWPQDIKGNKRGNPGTLGWFAESRPHLYSNAPGAFGREQ